MSQNPKIIAIGGLKNSGKDEVAKMLQYCLNAPSFLRNYWSYKHFNKLFKKNYTITSFATPLKKTLGALLDIPVEKFNDRDFKENTYIYFPSLTIGEKINELPISDNKFSKSLAANDFSFLANNQITIRQLLQCFGTEIMRKFFGDYIWINATMKTKENIIISDLRFKAEANAVKDSGGYMIYVSRDICTPGNHASEKEILELVDNNQFDFYIYNNGTLEDLFKIIKRFVKCHFLLS